MTDPMPVFGTEDDYATGETTSFELLVVGPLGPERIQFAATGEASGGALLELASAQGRRGEVAQAAASAAACRVIQEMLADDDGVPAAWAPTPGDTDPDTGQPTTWRRHDFTVSPTYDGALPVNSECSSRRRFMVLVGDREYRVKLDVLMRAAKWMAGLTVRPVPTPAPRPSQSGRSTTGQRRRAGSASRK